MRPYAPGDGAHVDFEYDTDAARVRASYGEQKCRRLAALEAGWDPDNVFRCNVNIAPEPAGTGVPFPRGTTDTSVTGPSG